MAAINPQRDYLTRLSLSLGGNSQLMDELESEAPIATQPLKEALAKSQKLFGGVLKEALKKKPSQTMEAACKSLSDTDGDLVLQAAKAFLESLDEEALKTLAAIQDETALLKSHALLQEESTQALKAKGKNILRQVLSEATHLVHHILDVFIAVTGLTEVGNQELQNAFADSPSRKMSSLEAKTKLEFYIALISYPSVIFASALAICGSAATAAVATTLIVAASLIAIPVYIRFFKPCPKSYPGLENLVSRAMEEENPPVFKRMDILRQIQDAFRSGKGVLLTAKPGVGKTSVVTGLAELIAAQASDPLLAKAQLFAGNANQLKGGMWLDMISLNSLKQTFGRHSKEFILFLDEIKSSFEKDAVGGKPVESLLTFHDKFRYMICATTTAEYEQNIKDHESFNRRFVHIEVKPLQSAELETALYEYLHFKAPQLILETGTMQHIMEKAKGQDRTSQVDQAMSTLSSAIVKATSLSFKALEDEIYRLETEIGIHKNHLLHDDRPNLQEADQAQTKLQTLQGKRAELVAKKNQLERIRKLEKECFQLKLKGYQLAAKPSRKIEWLRNQVLQKTLSKHISQKRQEFGLAVGINKALINTL